VDEPAAAERSGERLRDFPSYVAVEVTNACNLQCRHCNYRHGLPHYTRERGFIAPDLMEKVLDEAAGHGASVLMNYDGEPLMHPRFTDFLALATRKEVTTYFNTNGTLFTREVADRLVSFYRGSIFWSIDGDREWFSRIRVPADYDQVTGNLSYFLTANQAAGWPITVGVSLCNLGQSPEERRAFLEEWLPRVNYVSMGEVNDEFGTMISEPMTALEILRRPVCEVPWNTCGVCHNGDVIPCSIYVTRANSARAIFGNVREESLAEIWRGEPFREFRRMVAEERYGESFCDRCQRWRQQFVFPEETRGRMRIARNGYWTSFQNLDRGELNFRARSLPRRILGRLRRLWA
jgi:radical SAM protein with 4Fe4S-binding SPASM domain